MQRTCYYDATMTGDINFGLSSKQAAEEQSEYRKALRNPPKFNDDLSLRKKVLPNEHVNVSFYATSEFSSVIIYKLLHGPNGSTLNEASGLFQWTVPSEIRNAVEFAVQVSATDDTYNLTSSYEVIFVAEANNSIEVRLIFILLFVLVISVLVLYDSYMFSKTIVNENFCGNT